MPALVRLSANLHTAIVTRWKEKGLDEAFRDYWDDFALEEYPVLHDTEAQPSPPGPYCVYEIDEPEIIGHATGPTNDTEIQTQSIDVQLRVHAKNTIDQDGKQTAAALAEAVCEAYDDRTPMDISPDTMVETTRGMDQSVRLSDEEWSWIIEYTYTIDVVYDI